MSRPAIDDVVAPSDIDDWYWTRAELDAIAKRLGVSRAGNKAEVAARLRAVLAGQPPPASSRRTAGDQLAGNLTLETVVPQGQRMTRAVRDFLTDQIGPQFRFDAHMRRFFSEPDGRTLGDAVALWHSTRGSREAPTEQFEYNRFTIAYHREHPQAGRDELLAAWAEYKATPVHRRGKA